MTAPLPNEEKVVGLFAVFEAGINLVAVNCTGAYTVNWGDGSGDINTGSGVTAERNVLWSGAANTSDVGIANAVAVTLTASGSTVNRTEHGFTNRQQVAFSSIVSTTGISTYVTYFVINATTNTFQLSTTYNGSAITLTTDGSGSAYTPQYRQVIVTITMQSAGTFTDCNLHVRHSLATVFIGANWLDLAISGSLLTGLRVGNALVGNAGTALVQFARLEKFNLVSSSVMALGSVLLDCVKLQSIVGLAFSTMTPKPVTAVTFTASGSTVNWTAHGLANGTPVMLHAVVTSTGIAVNTNYFVVNQATNTFQLSATVGGSALTITGNGSGTASAGVSLSGAFNGCRSLRTVPLFSTGSVTNMSNMLLNCLALQTVPLFNTAAVTNMSGMFNLCFIESVPLFNTAAVTNMSQMFNGCSVLQTVPLFNTAAVTDMSSMFLNCTALQAVPLFNTAAVASMSIMFNNCRSLESVPLFNTSAVTNMNGLFRDCFALQAVPMFDASAASGVLFMFLNCRSLTEGALLGTNLGVSYLNCPLSAGALDRIYTGLSAAGATKTIVVTGCPGVAGDDPTIATAKGWTVVGS